MPDYIHIQNQDFSFLGKGAKMIGVFHLQGPTHIYSSMDGEIFMENKADLCIEKTGVFTGNIVCHNLEIYGRFEGKIQSTGKVTIYPPAVLTGIVNSKNLVIYPGAVINIEGATAN